MPNLGGTSQYAQGQGGCPEGPGLVGGKGRAPIHLRQDKRAALPWACRTLAAMPVSPGAALGSTSESRGSSGEKALVGSELLGPERLEI